MEPTVKTKEYCPLHRSQQEKVAEMEIRLRHMEGEVVLLKQQNMQQTRIIERLEKSLKEDFDKVNGKLFTIMLALLAWLLNSIIPVLFNGSGGVL